MIQNDDTISRQAAIDIIEDFPHGGVWNVESMEEMVYRIKQLPSAQPETKNPCSDCQEFDCCGCQYKSNKQGDSVYDY